MPYYPRKRKNNRGKKSNRNKRSKRIKKKAPTYPSKTSNWKVALTRPPVFQSPSYYCRKQLYYEQDAFGTAFQTPQIFFTANSVYDPYNPSGGHQAMGFDQMMLLYNHFCVFRSKITVTFQNTNELDMVRVGIGLFPDTTIPLSANKVLENGYVKTTMLSPLATSGAVRTLTLDCDVKKFFGKTKYKDLMDNPNLCGDVSNDPIEKVYFGLFAFNIADVENTLINVDVMLSYDCNYFEPRKLDPS